MNRSPTVKETIDRWKERVARRMRARDPNRPPWDRQRFLDEFVEDHPGDQRAIGFVVAFEAALKDASRRFARDRKPRTTRRCPCRCPTRTPSPCAR
jgi:hypothetical protein